MTRRMRPHRPRLDHDSASRLLQGAVHPDDAPPGYAAVAALLASAAQTAPVDEQAAAVTVSAMAAVMRGTPPAPIPLRRRPMIGKLLAGKALAAMATVAVTATGAAAATGSLPTPVQGAVAGAVSHVGIDLPHHDTPASARADDDGEKGHVEKSEGDDPKVHDQGDDHGQGDVISGITHDPALEGQPKGPTVSDEASDGRSHAGEVHGDNRGPGRSGSGGSDDPVGHDADEHGTDDHATDDHGTGVPGTHEDDHHGTEVKTGTSTTTSTTAPTTSTTVDDHRGSGEEGSGSSGSGGGGKGRSGR